MEPRKSITKDLSEGATPSVANQIDLLFETSWEVCNKVGGIYAVLSTKARTLGEQFGDKLIFHRPDLLNEDNPSPYFKERKTLLKQAQQKLQLPWGISIRVGRWDIPGAPQVVLVNWGETARHLSEIYGEMWRDYGVDSLHSYGDYEESCAFAVASAIVIQALTQHLKANPSRVVAHFDEWTTGMGLFYQFKGDQMAVELNMQSKHSLEKAAAHNADCFTTVSEVTARECEQLLQIRPQVVTPNGFEPDFVPKTVKYNRLRKDGRDKLLTVAKAVTGHQYGPDTFIIATSGRHEYRNKGLDMYLDVLAGLEQELPADQEALAFVLVPGWVKEPSGDVVTNLYFDGAVKTQPDYLTHRLNNEGEDEVCRRIEQLQGEGKLKKLRVIYVPSYLDGHDGVVDITYYDLLPALDLTMFPSYYEPWGYTPLESVAFGVPTITDDKAGFGQWVLDNFQNGLMKSGVYVVDRTDSNYAQAAALIRMAALEYITEDVSLRLKARNLAFLTAAKADWKFFILNSDKAFEIALSRNVRR